MLYEVITLIVIRDTMTYEQLDKFIGMFIEDTYRIKGFVCLEGQLSLVDCVGAHLRNNFV